MNFPLRMDSIISSEYFSYSCADIFCTSDSLIAPDVSFVSGDVRSLFALTAFAASLLGFTFSIFLSALYKSIALAADLASLSLSYRAS